MTQTQVWLATLIIALVTLALRALPFLIWKDSSKTPPLIRRLGATLPCAVMGMLVVYCLRGVHFTALSGFAPSLIACAAVVGLHLWRRNTLLSIAGGTVCYMVLVQLVF